MSLGYCNTFVKTDLNPANTDRNLLDASLPNMLKLVGVSFNPTENSYTTAGAHKFETFQIYDGDSDDGLILTFPIVLGIATVDANGGDFFVQNDSYISVGSGLYYKASSTHLGTASDPIVITVMYV